MRGWASCWPYVAAAARRTEERQQPLLSKSGTLVRHTMLCASSACCSRPSIEARGSELVTGGTRVCPGCT
eukprot:5401272-Prymnesium_polylepis.1